MNIAIISDIHGNLEALTAVFAYLDGRGIDTVYCLGDTIGYGANPNECCEAIRSRNAVCVLGNHDAALWDDEVFVQFTPMAQRAMSWTRSVVDADNHQFIKSLPLVVSSGDCTFVHASLDRPELFRYVFTEEDALFNLSLSRTPLCWIGHSHHPVIFSEKGETADVSRKGKFIVNVGSVGQPRDGDPRLSFGVFDTERFVYENIRLEYDVVAACRKIIDAGLPQRLGERLLAGI
ncbi:MAG TPA: metallophosphoesterase family protein [Bacteroidota bacterium]|nr:metallophosphoesterase family protein [Bacteroidota bacterium]